MADSNTPKTATQGQWEDLASRIKTISTGKQDTLVSGTNIKTVNGTSILGSGNITTPNGTITAVLANGTSVATSGVANIPAATTSGYGVTQLSSSTSSTSTSLAATASAVKAVHDAAVGSVETYTVAVSEWSDITGVNPFTQTATITATHTITANTLVELYNDDAVAFANHGFSIASVSNQAITIYAIERPAAAITLKISYKEIE